MTQIELLNQELQTRRRNLPSTIVLEIKREALQNLFNLTKNRDKMLDIIIIVERGGMYDLASEMRLKIPVC